MYMYILFLFFLDPVVLSSGYIVDRSTILDREDNLLFSRCPFSGKRLSSKVYPVEQKKKQIEHFRMKRDSNITQIARKLIAEGRFESFHDVLDAIEVYMKGIGENYLPLVRELAAIWSGSRNPPSTMLLVDRLKARPGNNKWMTAVESGRIGEKVYKIMVSVENFRDEGSRGSHRSYLALSLFDDAGELIERRKLFDDPYNGGNSPAHCVFGKQDRIVSSARVGYTYKLQYIIGSSPQYVQVEGLVCKIIPSIDSVTSYRMRDADGEEGLYIGPIDTSKFANGEGSLEYEDGKRFVGSFKNGAMVDGVLYRGSHIRHTLKRGKWTKSIDEALVEKYPSNMIVYDHAGSLHKPKTRVDTERSRDYSSVRKNYRVREDPLDDVRSRTTNRGRYDDYSASRHSRFESVLDDENCSSNRYGGRAMDYEEVTRYRKSDTSVSSGVRYQMKSKSADEEPPFSYLRNDGRGGLDDDDFSYEHRGRDTKHSKHDFDSSAIFPDVRRRDKSKNRGIVLEGTFPDVRRRDADGVHDDYSTSHMSHKSNKSNTKSRVHYEDEDDKNLDIHERDGSPLTRYRERREADYSSRHSNDPLFASPDLSAKETRYINKVMEDSGDNVYNSKSNHSRDSHRSNDPLITSPNLSAKESRYIDKIMDDLDEGSYNSKSNHSRSSHRSYNLLPLPKVPSHTPGQEEEAEDSASRFSAGAGQKNSSLGLLSEKEKVPIEQRPHVMYVSKLQKKLREGGKWLPAMTSGYLENYVKSLVFSVDDFVDKNLKCNLGIALYNETGQFVSRCIIFRTKTKSKDLFQIITSEQNIVSKAKPGYFYQLQYAVDSGHQDALQVKGWICKIFTGTGPVTSYYMSDKDGDKGYYFGPVNSIDQAHGDGYLEYENGCTFVGRFANGNLLNGTYYKVNHAVATMKNQKWTETMERELQRAYPQKIQVFKKDVRSDDIYHGDDKNNNGSSSFPCCG